MMRILFIICVGTLLPVASAAQQMNSENFGINAERVNVGGVEISTSANFILGDTFGESIISDPTSIPIPPPAGGGGTTGGGGGTGGIGADAGGPAALVPPVFLAPVCNGADFNGDGIVDLVDFGTLVFFWGVSNPDNSCVDINGNGTVGLVDFGVLVFEWTSTP